ncbi:MAG: ABC transporter ATP-binding protein [Halobacteria archaeon]|nr:ABC transporter ATP-binding protein [Halobacteria archaeon]
MSKPMSIEVTDLRKSYGDRLALDGVSFSVTEGEVFTLIGPNGAGKTTLVRCLTGSLRPSGGEATVLGEPPSDTDKTRIGLLPQDFNPSGLLTPREIVEYYAGLYPESETADAEEVLEKVGIHASADSRYSNLSGGQKRRTCVASSLVNDPDLLFLDEPTTGIDPDGRRSMWELIEDLAESGTTVFLTTHYMEEAEYLADTVALIDDGEIVEIDDPDALIREYGGESRLEVSLGTQSRDISELESDGFSVEVDPDTQTVRFEEIDPTTIGEAVELLESSGIEYDELVWKQPDLEDVYLNLTGSRFGSKMGDGEEGGVEA